jgi:glyoxylase-like metal-dependent hydrolase (beta-lactamase superfamily II)
MLRMLRNGISKLVIPLPFMGDVNCYFVRGENGFTVIDTGVYSEPSIQLWEGILASGIIIEKVILTHTHIDHMGMAGWLQKRLQVPVHMSALGYEIVKSLRDEWRDYENGTSEYLPNPFFHKHEGPSVTKKNRLTQMKRIDFEPDSLFENDDVLLIGDERYKAIWTPGHATDHFCFYSEKERVMFVGDHVLGDISPVIIIESEGVNPLQDYLDSMERLRYEQVDLALPGHGEPIQDLKVRIAEIMDGHHQRFRQILDTLAEKGMSAGVISERLYPHNEADKLSMSKFQMTLARLIYLESQGQISSRDDGVIQLFYQGKMGAINAG